MSSFVATLALWTDLRNQRLTIATPHVLGCSPAAEARGMEAGFVLKHIGATSHRALLAPSALTSTHC